MIGFRPSDAKMLAQLLDRDGSGEVTLTELRGKQEGRGCHEKRTASSTKAPRGLQMTCQFRTRPAYMSNLPASQTIEANYIRIWAMLASASVSKWCV